VTPPPGLPAKLGHFIGGAHVESADGATFDVADPVTNLPYASVAAGGPEDIDRAVIAAAEAFSHGPWPQTPARARASILNRIADGIEARADRIAELETFDTGLPVTQTRGQAARAAENCRFFADLAVTQHEDAFSSPGQSGYVIRKPAGVAYLDHPWNSRSLPEAAPALASAVAVVLCYRADRCRPACCPRS
jgi:5-carboxymethyl-2-hydroxymuconic-semialdehyde dehydrogenase